MALKLPWYKEQESKGMEEKHYHLDYFSGFFLFFWIIFSKFELRDFLLKHHKGLAIVANRFSKVFLFWTSVPLSSVVSVVEINPKLVSVWNSLFNWN